jgi:hypothetical protein
MMNNYSTKQSSIIIKLLEITKDTPNDQDLGKKIRALVAEYKSLELDKF